MRFGITCLFMLIGILLILHPFAILSYFTYPFLMWGVIGFLDFLNLKRWKTSMIKKNQKIFWGIIVPASVAFWIFFEFTNFIYIQWDYLNIPHNKLTAILLTLLSYSTVIPLVIESIWLLHGPIHAFSTATKVKTRYPALLPLTGCFVLLLYIYKPSFWVAQCMWLIPFFFFFPFIPFQKTTGEKTKTFILSLIGGVLLSGLIWEALNFWANTGWQYLIFPSAFHLFAMPYFGYLGYIPFVFSLISVYLFINKFFPVTPKTIILLYILALGLSAFYIIQYFNRFHIV